MSEREAPDGVPGADTPGGGEEGDDNDDATLSLADEADAEDEGEVDGPEAEEHEMSEVVDEDGNWFDEDQAEYR